MRAVAAVPEAQVSVPAAVEIGSIVVGGGTTAAPGGGWVGAVVLGEGQQADTGPETRLDMALLKWEWLHVVHWMNSVALR